MSDDLRHAQPSLLVGMGARTLALRYGVALAVSAITIGLSTTFATQLEQTPFILFYAAVAFGAWYGGRWPGLLVAVLCGLAGAYYLLEPKHSLAVEVPDGLVSLGSYAFVTGVIVLLTTQLRVARRAAHASAEQYRQIFEGTADAVLVFDDRGHYIDVNPAALALLGYTRDELLRRQVGDLSTAADQERVQERMRQLRAEGVWRGEAQVRRKDGRQVPVEIVASLLDGRGGASYLMTFRDITARRALERAQQEFLATVTHELKSPLTAMRGHAQLMRRQHAYNERGLDTILAQIRHLERLIGDLLDASRAGAGQLELHREPMDLVELAFTGAEEAQTTTARHTIQVNAPDAPIVGDWDRDRLSQVLRNLLSNAIKYAPAGGLIVVRVALADGVARLSVTDQGLGISPAALEHVFARFYRGDEHRDSASGLGLGLHIAQQIIVAHGGRLDVTSQVGSGSTFTVLLPEG